MISNEIAERATTMLVYSLTNRRMEINSVVEVFKFLIMSKTRLFLKKKIPALQLIQIKSDIFWIDQPQQMNVDTSKSPTGNHFQRYFLVLSIKIVWKMIKKCHNNKMYTAFFPQIQWITSCLPSLVSYH